MASRKVQTRAPRKPMVLKAHRSGAGVHRSPLDYRRSGSRTAVREQLEEAPDYMYHLTPEAHYRRFSPDDPYVSERYYEEGFIHFTDPESELAPVGNRYYRDDSRPYVVLTVDKTLVTAPLKYEDPQKIFPHLYGPLNRDAIVCVRVFERKPDGSYAGPGEELDGE